MFKQHLLSLVTQGIDDLAQAQSCGRVPKNGLSESHFFSVWIGQSIKSKRFDICVVPLLKSWQQQARTSGAGANLKHHFVMLKQGYSNVPQEQTFDTRTVEELVSALEGLQWQVTNHVVLGKKSSIKSQGLSSLVIAPADFAAGFGQSGQLSVYVRGDLQQFVDSCYELGLLAFKMTEYKSIVKFHSHFILDAQNNHHSLPQYPSSPTP